MHVIHIQVMCAASKLKNGKAGRTGCAQLFSVAGIVPGTSTRCCDGARIERGSGRKNLMPSIAMDLPGARRKRREAPITSGRRIL